MDLREFFFENLVGDLEYHPRRALVYLLLSALLFAPPATPLLTPQQRLTLTTEDGWRIAALLYGQGPRAVVLAHGGRFTKESWADQAHALAQAGFRVLAIDLRGFGESKGAGQPASNPDRLDLDVLAAVRYLRNAGATTVAVVGASMGGIAAAEASVLARPGEIDRVVLLAHGPIDHPERMQARKLFIVARGDLNAAGTPRLVRIREQYEKAPEPKELVILDGHAHAQFLFATPQGPRLLREILRFLSAP